MFMIGTYVSDARQCPCSVGWLFLHQPPLFHVCISDWYIMFIMWNLPIRKSKRLCLSDLHISLSLCSANAELTDKYKKAEGKQSSVILSAYSGEKFPDSTMPASCHCTAVYPQRQHKIRARGPGSPSRAPYWWGKQLLPSLGKVS